MGMNVIVDGKNRGFQAEINSRSRQVVEAKPMPSGALSVSDSVGTTSKQLFSLSDLDADALQLQNQSLTASVHIHFGSAAAGAADFTIPPGGVYSTPPGVRYEGEIQIIATAAGTPVTGIIWREGET